MKKYFLTASVIVVVLVAGSLMAQAATQTQTKPKPKADTQAAKPPAQKPEPGEQIPAPAPNALFPAVVARVNGKPILGRDLEQQVRAELAPIGNPAWKDLREDYRAQLTSTALSQLVGDELLYQKAVAGGVAATDAEIKAEFDGIAKTYPNDAALNVELANRGMDRKALMRDIGKNLIISKFIEANVSKKITVTPEEISDYYAKNPDQFKHPDLIRTSHILISVPEKATAEQDKAALQRAQALLDRAKKGEDFAGLAKEYSMDPSASQGGDIGLSGAGDLEPAYEKAAEALKVGEIGGPVRTSYGYHILKLTDRKKAGTATLDEVRNQLGEFLKSQKEDAELGKLVNQLQGEAKIEVLIGKLS